MRHWLGRVREVPSENGGVARHSFERVGRSGIAGAMAFPLTKGKPDTERLLDEVCDAGHSQNHAVNGERDLCRRETRVRRDMARDMAHALYRAPPAATHCCCPAHQT